jgi:PKD repeat protein
LSWASTSGQSEGGGPLHSLTLGQDGNFYGFGGEVASSSDTVFQLTSAGLFTTLVPASTSNANGGDPNSLFQTSDGSFYGTTRYGNDSGPSPDGTVFKMVLSTSSSSPCTASTTPTTNGGAWAGAEVAGGSATVTPTATGTFVYSLSCTYPQPTGSVGPQTAQLIVNAAATPAPTVTLTATPNSVTLGQSSTLSWSSTNTTSCTASGAWNGSEALSGGVVETPTVAGAQTFTLTCTGAGGSATATATLTALAPVIPAPTVALTANPGSITVGQSATLTWTSTNATSCSASNGWSGTEALTGTQAVTPAATGTTLYTLTCSGGGGSASASAPLVVSAAPAPTVRLSASSTSITIGQSVIVTWSSTNDTSCTAGGAWSGTQATAGSVTETPSVAGTSTYTLVCSGAGGATATSSVTVTVQAAAGASTETNLSGRAGGGGLGWGSLVGLALLVALRARGVLRVLSLSALSVLTLTVPATAQDAAPQWQFNWNQSYVGVRVGSGDYRESSSHLDSEVAGAGFSGTDTSITDHRIGGAVYGGVPFYGPLSLELGFADLGRYPVAISTPSSDIAPLSQTIARKLWPAGQALTLGLAAPLDIVSWFAVEPRLGVLAFRSKQEVFTPLGTFSDDRTGGGLDAGVSFLVHAARALYIGAGFDCFDLGGHASVFLYSAEITYHFGT